MGMPGRHQFQHRFRSNVCRWTAPREIILNLLSRAKGHLSAKEIYAALYSAHPAIGLTTVYRTMELLYRLGIVQKITAGDKQSRYEIKSADRKDHHHLICTRCGKIVNCRASVREEIELVKKTEEALTEKYNFTIQDHNIEFLGLCDTCR